MDIGQKVYYEKETGNIILIISFRSGTVVETTKEQDFISYKALSERDPETVDMIQLEYGAYDDDYKEGGYISRIDLEKMEPLFTYPDRKEPEIPKEPRPALSKQV